MVVKFFDDSVYVTLEDSIFALEEISKTQVTSVNSDEILLIELKQLRIFLCVKVNLKKNY